MKSFNGERQQWYLVPGSTRYQVCWKIHMSNTYVCASTSIYYGFMTDSVLLLPAVCWPSKECNEFIEHKLVELTIGNCISLFVWRHMLSSWYVQHLFIFCLLPIMKQQSTPTGAIPRMTFAMVISLAWDLFQQSKLQVASTLWRNHQAECYRLMQCWPRCCWVDGSLNRIIFVCWLMMQKYLKRGNWFNNHISDVVGLY